MIGNYHNFNTIFVHFMYLKLPKIMRKQYSLANAIDQLIRMAKSVKIYWKFGPVFNSVQTIFKTFFMLESGFIFF